MANYSTVYNYYWNTDDVPLIFYIRICLGYLYIYYCSVVSIGSIKVTFKTIPEINPLCSNGNYRTLTVLHVSRIVLVSIRWPVILFF